MEQYYLSISQITFCKQLQEEVPSPLLEPKQNVPFKGEIYIDT